ncbi:MAG: aspartate-semialdehyde dehydrogenase [bacterium]
MKNSPAVAVVGAAGMVGRELLDLLESRRFPAGSLLPFGSGRKEAVIRFRGRPLRCPKPSLGQLRKARLVFFVSTDDISGRLARKLADEGIWCIDDSSMFRLDPGVPLVIPEVNSGELSPRKKLIAGPNCTITGLAVAAWPLHRRFGVKKIRLATYQAVSGAGRRAVDQLEKELRASSAGKTAPAEKSVLPRPIAFNLFPQVGSFDSDGNSVEEVKVARELRKIWKAPGLKLSCTAVRVPVLRGHSLAAWISTGRLCPVPEAIRLIRHAPGVKFFEGLNYPTPLDCVKTLPVMVGRVRKSQSSPREIQMWIVSDNLYKGSALNSIQIAEFILKNRWI